MAAFFDLRAVEYERHMAAKQRPWSGLVRLIHGSFLDVEFGEAAYDAAVSVMALPHRIPSVKRDLYRRVCRALRPGGVFVNADYIEPERQSIKLLEAFASAGHAARHRLHIDLTLPREAELRLLRQGGFDFARTTFLRARCATFVASTIDGQS